MNDDLIRRQDALKVVYEQRMEAIGCIPEAFNAGIDTSASALEKIPSAQQWIPCSERLPEDDRTKVVTLANGSAEAGYYSNGDWWCVGDSITLENPTVIAWMPLPKPYEAEE